MNFTYLIKKNCRKYPGKVALIENNSHITYQEFWRKLGVVSRLYQDLGVKRGERILIALPNSINFLIYYFAAMKMGATAVPVKIEYRMYELSVILKNSQPRLVVSNDQWLNENAVIAKELKSRIKSISTDQY